MLFAFFIGIEARFLEFMLGDGDLHSLGDELNPLLNLRELFGWSKILVIYILFGGTTYIYGIVGCSVSDAPSLNNPHVLPCLKPRDPPAEPSNHPGSTLRTCRLPRGFRLTHLIPHHLQCEALFPQQLSRQALLLAQQAQKQMRRADIFVVQVLSLLCRVCQHFAWTRG